MFSKQQDSARRDTERGSLPQPKIQQSGLRLHAVPHITGSIPHSIHISAPAGPAQSGLAVDFCAVISPNAIRPLFHPEPPSGGSYLTPCSSKLFASDI